MSCQCRNIEKCKNDIRILNEGIEYVKELINIDSNVEDRLNELASLYPQTFTVTNISELVSNNNQLNDRINELFLQLNRRITDEIENLEEDLKRLKEEDKSHHKKAKAISFTW